MVNMGELFAHSRIGNIDMERVPLSSEEAKNYLLLPGDLLFARQSLILSGAGKCSIFLDAEEPTTFEGHLIRARVDMGKGDPIFYYYFFNSPQGRNTIESIVEQVAAAGIRGSDLSRLEVPCPPLLEQKAIARILGTLDDKIELNRRMNQTLDGITQAIFKSWFVDFDPVRAKTAGRQPQWLAPHIADLFPDSFEESELGEIPKGWMVETINNLASINAQSLCINDQLEVIDYIEINKVMKGEILGIVRYKRGTEPSRARRRLRHGDTVLSTVRPNRGSYFLCLDPPDTLIASTGFVVLSPKNDCWAFLYTSLTRREVGEELGRQADGAAYPAIRTEVVCNLKMIIPVDLQLIYEFERITQPLYQKAASNRDQSNTLAALRDTLLPMLISGELRVPDAERIVGRIY